MRGSKQAILTHIVVHGGITSAEAFEHYGITRLSARIFDLRKMGYNIVTQEVLGKTRFDEPCKYARYVLANGERQETK